MPTTETRGDIRTELYVRESLPTPAQRCSQTIIARLERLSAEGHLGDYSVASWAKRLPISGTEETTQRDLYNEFTDWARENGVRLTPFFDTRECYSMETGAKRTELVFPALCIAVYEDDELKTVAPHATADGPTSVTDCLDRLYDETGDERAQQTTLTAD